MMTVAMGLLRGGFANFNIQTFLITILVLCVSLSFHEMAHAWAAYRMGDDTAALQGRLSMNPLVHLDPIGSIAFIIGGIGWARPVPINPARFKRNIPVKKGLMLTSAAGPLSNLILAAASALLFYLTQTARMMLGSSTGIFDVIFEILIFFYSANIILAVFNLLPVPPLDGFKIFGSILPNSIYYRLMGIERYIGLVFLMLIIFGRGILSSVLNIVAWPFNQVIMRPLELIFTWLWRAFGFM